MGISLTPWLKAGVTPEIVKMIVNAEQEEDEGYLQEENTAQMLQKYAEEDDDDEEDFYENSGVNYSYLYDSPFDAVKDKDILVQIVVIL